MYTLSELNYNDSALWKGLEEQFLLNLEEVKTMKEDVPIDIISLYSFSFMKSKQGS
jgi:hypothetical protein